MFPRRPALRVALALAFPLVVLPAATWPVAVFAKGSGGHGGGGGRSSGGHSHSHGGSQSSGGSAVSFGHARNGRAAGSAVIIGAARVPLFGGMGGYPPCALRDEYGNCVIYGSPPSQGVAPPPPPNQSRYFDAPPSMP
jgi:hypothetical protein